MQSQIFIESICGWLAHTNSGMTIWTLETFKLLSIMIVVLTLPFFIHEAHKQKLCPIYASWLWECSGIIVWTSPDNMYPWSWQGNIMHNYSFTIFQQSSEYTITGMEYWEVMHEHWLTIPKPIEKNICVFIEFDSLWTFYLSTQLGSLHCQYLQRYFSSNDAYLCQRSWQIMFL